MAELAARPNPELEQDRLPPELKKDLQIALLPPETAKIGRDRGSRAAEPAERRPRFFRGGLYRMDADRGNNGWKVVSIGLSESRYRVGFEGNCLPAIRDSVFPASNCVNDPAVHRVQRASPLPKPRDASILRLQRSPS